MVELRILIKASGNFVKISNNPALCHAPTIYAKTKIFVVELKAVFVDHRTESALEFVEFLNTSMSHTHTTSILLLQTFFSGILLHSYNKRDRKEALMGRSEGHEYRIIQNLQKFF